jgi:hypothetical protein
VTRLPGPPPPPPPPDHSLLCGLDPAKESGWKPEEASLLTGLPADVVFETCTRAVSSPLDEEGKGGPAPSAAAAAAA